MLKKEEVYDIKISLNDINELFNSLDPSPFLERDLDEAAAEYITDYVKYVHYKRATRIIIHLPKKHLTKISERNIKKAIHNYYNFMIDYTLRKFNHLMKDGRKALLIGITFLASCLAISEFLHIFFTGFTVTFLREGLVIAGWVGMWKPINIFLYEWWPLTREIRIYKKIKDMEVVLKPTEKLPKTT